MNQEDINAGLEELILEQKSLSFTNPKEANTGEALGIVVSNYCQWSSPAIFEVIESILEDSNFHELNAAFRSLVENPANIQLLKEGDK